jgi:AGCS family alanine or glycine:cation symporter
MHDLLNTVSSFIWGPFTLILILGTGVFLSLGLKGFTFSYILFAFKQIFKNDEDKTDGQITSFQSLTTALSATVGTWKYCRCSNSYLYWRPRRYFLDVDFSIIWDGNKICRSIPGN